MAAPTFSAVGTYVTGTGGQTVSWPAHLADDIGALIIEQSNLDSYPDTPSGWTYLTEVTSGPTTVVVFWRRATSGAESDVSVTLGGGTSDHTSVVIATVRGCKTSGDPYSSDSKYNTIGTYPSGSHETIAWRSSNDLTYPNTDCLNFFIAAWAEDIATDRVTAYYGTAWSGVPTERFQEGHIVGTGGGVVIATATTPQAGDPGFADVATADMTATDDAHTWASIAIVFLPPQLTITFGAATETDAATRVSLGTTTVPVGSLAETSVAGSISAVKLLSVGSATSAGAAQSIAPARLLSMAETLNTSENTPLGLLAKLLVEELSLATSTSALGKYGQSLSDQLISSDRVTLGWPTSMVDTLNVSEALSGVLSMKIAEQLGLTAAMTPMRKFGIVTADTLSFNDALGKFISGVAMETLGLTSTMTDLWRFPRTLADTLEVTPALTGSLVFRVVSEEELNVSDAELLQWVLTGELGDTIELGLGALSSAGDFTAWAINTTNSAVSQYTNFNFNSFADMYPHYVAASPTGLYALTGDTDAGTDIIGKIRSGYAQFGGAKLATLDMAYLGVRGDGDYVFRVVTADGQSYNYTASAVDMKSARIQLGRGLRARYIAFELESAGQDFDLESVEILPLALSRRV